MEKKREYCKWCFITLSLAEPRRHRIVGNPEGGLEEEIYHLNCFHLLELKEMIAKDVKRQMKRKERMK